jgi:hypothetical protein
MWLASHVVATPAGAMGDKKNRWEHDMKVDIYGVGFDHVDWI